jgi:predicted ester cyclase
VSTEENKAVSRRAVERLNARDLEGLGKLFTEDNSYIELAGQLPTATYEVFAELWEAIPDLRVAIESQTGEGNTVVNRFVCYGTYTGNFRPPFSLDIPPTGRQVQFTGCSIDEVVEGKLVGHVLYIDWINLLFLQMNELDYAAERWPDSAFRFSTEGVVEGPFTSWTIPTGQEPS